MAKCGKGKSVKRVLCGERTKPPHTDEVNPGRCSRVRNFCLAPGEPEPDWACWQHRYRLVEKLREFKDCADAANTLAEEAKLKLPGATTEYEIKDLTAFPVPGRDGKRYTYEISVYWQVDWASMVINLPQYSWPNMTTAEMAAVKNTLLDLRAHEEGHVSITEEFIDELSQQSIRISGSGATSTAAIQDCSVQLAIHEAKTIAELRDRQNQYDDKTEHGVKQSEVGGVDVLFICPSE